MGSVYVPPASGGGGTTSGGSTDEATRFIQYNYLRNYMGAHMLSWPSYRYIYLQTIIFVLAFLVIGIMHHFQVHDRTVFGVKWSRWSTKNRVIKLGKKERLPGSPGGHHLSSIRPTYPQRVDPVQGAQRQGGRPDRHSPARSTQPAIIEGVQTSFAYPPSSRPGPHLRSKTLDRSTIFSASTDMDDDHASIEGVRGPSFFTLVGRIPRWLFSPSYRRALRDDRRYARQRARRQRKRRVIEFPSFGRLIALFFVTALPIVLCFIGADYINPNSAVFDFRSSWMSANDAYLYTIGGIARRKAIEWGRGPYPSITTNPAGVTLPYRDWWTAGDRIGDFAFALTPLVVIVALKQTPWALLSTKWLGGLAFDKLNFLHKWVGRLIWVFATAHVGAWSVQLAKDQQYNLSMWHFVFWWVKFRWGIVAYSFLTLLMFLSLSPFRMDTYEWFYIAHVVCAFGFLLTSALHHPPLWPWMGAALIWWALERGHRMLKVMWINGIGFKTRQRSSASMAAHGSFQPPSTGTTSFSVPHAYGRTPGVAIEKEGQWTHRTYGEQHQQGGLPRSRAGAKNPSVITSSSYTSESTYVDNYNSHVGKLASRDAPTSSSHSTPVNSPPLAGRRVAGIAGAEQMRGFALTDVVKEVTAEDMYTGSSGGGAYLNHPQSYQTEMDVADGKHSPGSDTPPMSVGIGVNGSVASQSRVHLLQPGLNASTAGLPLTPRSGLSPNPSMQDVSRSPGPHARAAEYGQGYSSAPVPEPAPMAMRGRVTARSALPAGVLAMLKPGYAFAQVLPGQTVRLTLRTPHSLTWRPGQYVNLNVPDVAWWQSHPFTIASACNTSSDEARAGAYGYIERSSSSSDTGGDRTMVLIIRARLGFTLSLWEHICKLRYQQIEGAMRAGQLTNVPQKHQTGVQIRAIVDGPYGSTGRIHWGAHSTVMIICGGSGVSFGLSVLEHLCTRMAEQASRMHSYGYGEHGGVPPYKNGKEDRRAFLTRRIRFVWILREFVHLQWAASALRRCLQLVSPAQLQVDIFVTHFNDESHYEQSAGAPPGAPYVSASQHERAQAKASSSSSGMSQGFGDDSLLLSPPGTPGFAPTMSTGSMLPPSASYTERAARFTEGPEQDEYEVEAEDLTNFDGELDGGGLSRAEMEMNRRVQKEGKLRRAHTRRLTQRGRGRGRGGRGGGTSGSRGGRDEDRVGSGNYLSSAEMAAFSEVHGGAPVPSSEPLRFAYLAGPAAPVSDVGANVLRNGKSSMPTAATASASRAQVDPAETPIDLDEREDEDMRVIAELARPGHPKLDKIVREECAQSLGRVMLTSCGPASLGTVLRSIATKQMDPDKVKAGDLRYHVNVVTESFEWGGS